MLQLLNVFFVRTQRIIQNTDFALQLVGHIRSLFLLDQSCSSKIFAILAQR